MSGPADGEGIPAGWTLELDPSARRTDHGRVLLGGAPFRILRLTAGGAAVIDDIVAGRPLSSSRSERRLARRLVDVGLANPHPVGDAGPSLRDVAVVIPVRDMADGLAATLASIGAVGAVIVVDDGSRDAAAVRAAARSARVLRNDRSEGPAAARERGWRSTDLPVIAFLDAEVVADTDAGWLAPLLAHLGDDAVGAVAPRVRPAKGTAPRLLAGYERVRSSLDLGPAPALVRPGSKVPYVPTTALVVRRDALESVAGFDTDLRFGEDVDLIWRLHARGWRVRYDPTVEVTHPSRPTVSAWVRQRVCYGGSAAPLARRHGRVVSPLQVSGWSALAWTAVLCGQPALGVGIGAGTTAALVPKLRGLEHPVRESVEIAGRGNLWAGRSVADALRRPWWPLAVVAAAVAPRARPALAAAVIIPPLLEWRSERPPVGCIQYIALRLLDDVAYGAGVWAGSVRARSVRALLPSFSGPIRMGAERVGPSPAVPGDAQASC